LDPTVTELQTQIERLNHAVQQARETQGRLEPMEHRLSQLVERCAEILERWADADQRHTLTIVDVEARLSEWASLERRIQQDSLQRSRALESTVEQEWEALRQRHEEPLKQLREQAAALGEVCVAAANLSLRGFERAEARFAALERDLHGQLSQLSRDIQATLTEVRRDVARVPAATGAVEPFPLEGVMRIHEELRDGGRGPAAVEIDTPHADDIQVPKQLAAASPAPEVTSALADRMASLERDVSAERQEVRDAASRADRMQRGWRQSLVVGIAALVVVGVLGAWAVKYVMGRLDEASVRAAAAERQAQTTADGATRQVATIRADADRQIAEARVAAERADLVSNVLAAPDLVRYALFGGDPAQADRPYGQALWSRARGFILTGSRLAPLSDGQTLQVWFVTDTGPVSVGVCVPDANGRVTLALDNPPRPPQAVRSVLVSLESGGAQAAPSATTVLARAPQ
jgi:hypothetical protein